MAVVMFIILFIIISGVKSSEKTAIEKNKSEWRAEYDKEKRIKSDFENRMTDKYLEEKCRDDCLHKNERYLSKRNEIENAVGYEPCDGMVWLGLMAESGKVPNKHTRRGFESIYVPNNIPSDDAYKIWENYYNFICWLDNELEKTGVRDRIGLCFCGCERGKTIAKFIPLDEIHKGHNKDWYFKIYSKSSLAFNWRIMAEESGHVLFNSGFGAPISLSESPYYPGKSVKSNDIQYLIT